MTTGQWLPSMEPLLRLTSVFVIILFLGFILLSPNAGANAQPVALQVLDPSDLGLNADIAFFGAGGAMTPDTSYILGTGIMKDNPQQFAAVYSRNSQGTFDSIIPPFMGDALLSGSVASSNEVVAPSCISEDASWIAIGNRADGMNSSGSVLLATMAPGDTDYTPVTRLYSNLLPGQSYFPYDMACTRDMSTIYITETSVLGASQKFIRLTIISRTNLAFTITRVEEYLDGTDAETAPIALLGNGEMYAMRGVLPNQIYVRRATDGWLFAYVDVASLSITPTNLALTNGGRRLIVTDRACNSLAGCGYVIDYSDELGMFNVNASTHLFGSSVLPAGANEAGWVVAVADNDGADATTHAGVVVGLPGYSTSFGALASFKPFANPSQPNETLWVYGDQLISPFGPSLSPTMRTGGMMVSHNLLSDDESLVMFGGPGDGLDTTGYIFIVENPMPTYTPPVAAPSPPTPTAPTEPVSAPVPVALPVAAPVQAAMGLQIIAATFGALAFAALVLTIIYVLVKYMRAPKRSVTVNKNK
jgi:hypothetical protein